MPFCYTAFVWKCTLITLWMHTSQSIRLPAHMYDYLNVHISVLLSVHTPVWLPECMYHCPFVCPHTCMTAWMYVSLSFCLSTHLMTTKMHTSVSICLSTHLYDCLNVCISVPLSVHTPYDYMNVDNSVLLSVHTSVWLPECMYHCPFVCPHTLWLHECG
jgi:hypothetical protein